MREYLRRYEEAGVDQVIFVMQAGRNSHEHIMESIEIFGREVLPEFAERDPGLTAKKEARLAPIVEAAMARKVVEPVDLGDYTFPAIPRQWADASGSEEMKAMLQRWADDRAAGRRDDSAGIARLTMGPLAGRHCARDRRGIGDRRRGSRGGSSPTGPVW